ncbi:MAG TPA: thiamine phosphate synthase [Firmicutes bacterium]|nr:thiamine phosphate synthase [Bacillota bacterium]
MNVEAKMLGLYVVTDRSYLRGRDFLQQIEAILQNGATFLQLREKSLERSEYIALAKEVKKLTDRYAIPFVINDDVEVALAVDADGVHVGQSDLEASKVRDLIGPDKILGVSAQTLEQARRAVSHGADYIGVGALFNTTSKKDAEDVTLETLHAITSEILVPVVGIGGIDHENVRLLKECKLAGVAVISAIFKADDVALATKQLKQITQELF